MHLHASVFTMTQLITFLALQSSLAVEFLVAELSALETGKLHRALSFLMRLFGVEADLALL